jgi:hypothetical protein
VALQPSVLHASATAIVAALVVGPCSRWPGLPLAGPRPPTATTPFEAPLPCGGGPFPALVPGVHDPNTVVIGSVAFPGLGYRHPPGRFAPGAPPMTVPVVVPPRSRAIVAVPPGQRDVAGLEAPPASASSPASAHRALVCTTEGPDEVFEVSFVIDGARCVPVSVTIDGVTTTRAVRFGVDRCPP